MGDCELSSEKPLKGWTNEALPMGYGNYFGRLKTLRKKMLEAKLGIYLVTDVKNIYYFTGFLDVADAVLRLIVPLDGQPILWTHPLSYDLATEQSKECAVERVEPGEKMDEKVLKDLKRVGVAPIGFDSLTVPTYLMLSKGLRNVGVRQGADIIMEMRRVKSDEEIACVRTAAALSDVAVEAGIEAVRPGVREYEVAAEIEFAMRKKGSEGYAFETLVASGPRSAYPHGVSTDRVIQTGDFVTMDVGAVHRGYRCDVTRTVVAGRATPRQIGVYNLVVQAYEEALRQIRSGVEGKAVDAVARKAIEEGGYGKHFVHGLGHGVGLDIHEPPRLSTTSEDILEEGNIVTDEPGIYIKEFGGVRVEDTVLVLKDHGEPLTKVRHGIGW